MRRPMRTVIAVAVMAASAAVGAALFAGRALVVADPVPPHADAIVMLAGSIADRVLETADLYRAGVAPRVVVTRERISPGELSLRARGAGLPEPCGEGRTAMVDRYTKVVLTVIALALVGLLARSSLVPGHVEAQTPDLVSCGTIAAPCYVSLVGGPPSLGAWQGGPIVILDAQRIVPRRY